MMLPVPGPGFRCRFWAGFGRKASASGPKSGSKLPALWPDQFGIGFWSVHNSFPAKDGPNAGPGRPARGPKAPLSNLIKLVDSFPRGLPLPRPAPATPGGCRPSDPACEGSGKRQPLGVAAGLGERQSPWKLKSTKQSVAMRARIKWLSRSAGDH